MQLEGGLADHPEVSDPQLTEHRAVPAPPPPPALDPQAELVHQPVGERRLGQPGQAQSTGAAGDLDLHPGAQLDRPAAVTPDHAVGLRGVDDFHNHGGGRTEHEWSGEQGVRAQR